MQINEERARFELEKNGSLAYADFERSGDVLKILYVFSPPELRGTGAAGELMQQIADYAHAQHLDIVPICGYAAAWLKKHRRS